MKRKYTQTASNNHTRNNTCFSFIFYIHQTRMAFVIGMRQMTQTRVLFFFLILLNSVWKAKLCFTLFSCSAVVMNTINTAWGHVLCCTTLPVPVTQAEKRRSTWSLWPCLSFQWSGQSGWNGDIRSFTDAAKYETNLKVRSKHLCGVVYQIVDVKIDNASHF